MAINNKKWTYDVVKQIVEEQGYELIEFFEPCKENNHKPKILISNGYEEKLMYFDNFKRGKFSFKPNTCESLKNKIEKIYNIKLDYIKCISHGKVNMDDIFEVCYNNKIVVRKLSSLIGSLKRNCNIFTDKRISKWEEDDMLDFLSDEKYGLSNIKIEYDKGKPKKKNNAMVYFVYDKLECSCRFGTIRDRLLTGDESIFSLNKGETFYKNMLYEKFGITNVGFYRIYKFETNTGKQTFASDIYNIDTGEVVKGVLTDNLKKRGYWFKSYAGEEYIKSELEKYNIEYETQKTFEDCKYIEKLKFDFYIPKINTIIEYDGEQHFKPIDIFGGEKEFKDRSIRDNIKNQYCKSRNIIMVRIPYYKFKEIPQIIQDIVSSN